MVRAKASSQPGFERKRSREKCRSCIGERNNADSRAVRRASSPGSNFAPEIAKYFRWPLRRMARSEYPRARCRSIRCGSDHGVASVPRAPVEPVQCEHGRGSWTSNAATASTQSREVQTTFTSMILCLLNCVPQDIPKRFPGGELASGRLAGSEIDHGPELVKRSTANQQNSHFRIRMPSFTATETRVRIPAADLP